MCISVAFEWMPFRVKMYHKRIIISVCTQHISVSKLCMHVHDPKREKVTPLQEKQHELNMISDRFKKEMIAHFYHFG